MPEGWVWTSIDDIAFVTKLAGFEYTEYIANNLTGHDGVPLFKGKNVQDGKIIYHFDSFIPKEISDELPRSQVRRKCLLTPYVGTIGNIGIHDKEGFYHLGSNVGKIEILNGNQTDIYEEYVKLFLQSTSGYKELTKQKKATAQDSISIEAIREVLIPIPPRGEQQRILQEISHWLSFVESIEQAETSINDTICAAKARILELAIHGKLVPQDPSDKPAIELLKRINPDFKPSDNLHYEGVLPIGWSLTRLGDVIDIISGTSYHKSDIVQIKSGIRILRGGNIQNGKIVLRDDDVFVHERLSAMYLSPCRGDIALVASTGSSELIGKSAIAEIDYPNTQIGAFLRIIRPKAIELAEYLGVIFQSNYYKNHIRDVAKGTNINNIKSIYITDFVVPIPPIDEQRRILQHLKALFTIANQISDSIDESQ